MPDHLADLLFVVRVGVGVKEAHRHRLHFLFQDAVDGLVDVGIVQGTQDFALEIQALPHLQA